MRISNKKRARLIAAAAGINLPRKRDRATVDDVTSQSGAPVSGTSESSGTPEPGAPSPSDTGGESGSPRAEPDTTTLTTVLTRVDQPADEADAATAATPGPAPWTLVWWTRRTRSLVNNQGSGGTPTLTPTADGCTIDLGIAGPVTINAQPARGTVALNADGTIGYVPGPRSTAADQLTVTLPDDAPFAGQNSHNRAVTITIPSVTGLPLAVDPTRQPFDARTGTVVVTGLTTIIPDPDDDPLTLTTADTTIVFDSQDADAFTWTPGIETLNSTSDSDALPTRTVTVVSDDRNGATIGLLVTEPADPTITTSAPSTPAAGSGVVTGTLTAAGTGPHDPAFTVSGATASGTDTFTTARGGTLIIDPDSCTYTYTPSGEQRMAASYLNATTADTAETITVTADDGQGGTVSETFTVPVDGITLPGTPFDVASDNSAPAAGTYRITTVAQAGTATTTLPGTPTADTQVAPDGSLYQATSTGTTCDITHIGPTGTTTTALGGKPHNSMQIAPDSTAYQVTSAGTTHSVVHITPTGSTTTKITGPPYSSMQIAADNSVHQTTLSGKTRTRITHVTAGDATSTTHPGTPHGGVQVSPDGTAYQITAKGDIYRVFAVASEDTTATTLTGEPFDVVQFTPDGTAYIGTRTGDADVGYTTHITHITATGTTITTYPGKPFDSIQIAADGTAYHTTCSGDTYSINTITPKEVVTTALTGTPYGSTQIGPDGTAYRTTRTGDAATGYTTHITHVTPTGTTTTTLPGTPSGGIQFDADGAAHQITCNASTYEISTISETGTTTTALPGTPVGDIRFAPDGTVRLTTYAGDSTTHITTIAAADTTTTELDGEPVGGIRLVPDGTAYQITTTDNTYAIAAITPAGVTTTALPGAPHGDLQIAPKGSILLTTVTSSGTTRIVVIKHAN